MCTLCQLQAQHDLKPTYQDKLSETLFHMFKSMHFFLQRSIIII